MASMIELDPFEKMVFEYFGLDTKILELWKIERLERKDDIVGMTDLKNQVIYLANPDDRLALYHELIHAIKGLKIYNIYLHHVKRQTISPEDVGWIESMLTNAAQIIYYFVSNPRSFFTLQNRIPRFDLIDLLLNPSHYIGSEELSMVKDISKLLEYLQGDEIDEKEITDHAILILFSLVDSEEFGDFALESLNTLVERQYDSFAQGL